MPSNGTLLARLRDLVLDALVALFLIVFGRHLDRLFTRLTEAGERGIDEAYADLERQVEVRNARGDVIVGGPVVIPVQRLRPEAFGHISFSATRVLYEEQLRLAEAAGMQTIRFGSPA